MSTQVWFNPEAALICGSKARWLVLAQAEE